MNKLIKYYCLSTFIIFLIFIIPHLFDYQWKGEYTYQIIAWMWIFFTFYILIIHRKIIYIKIYGIVLLALIGISILPMVIPFFTIVSFLFNMNSIQTIKLNDEYKIVVTKNVLAMKRAYIYKSESKFLIMEKSKNIAGPDYSKIISETLNINSNDPKLYELENSPIQKAKLISVNKDIIGIEYKILNKKKIIYHHLYETYPF